jgi:chorismate mutase
MKNYTTAFLGILLLISSAAFAQQPQANRARTPQLTSDDLDRSGDPSRSTLNSGSPLRVLFVGNSHTYVNDLPKAVELLSQTANESRLLETKMVAASGATLKDLWDAGQVAQMLRQEHWDYVVLQEQSQLPITNPGLMHKYVRLFAAQIKQAGARTVLYLTCARKDRPDTQRAIAEAYLAIAKETHAAVVPVGLVWQSVLKESSTLPLYDPDESHASPIGTYLTACAFYVAFYGKSPEGLSARIYRNFSGTGNQRGKGEEESTGQRNARMMERLTWEFMKNKPDGY